MGTSRHRNEIASVHGPPELSAAAGPEKRFFRGGHSSLSGLTKMLGRQHGTSVVPPWFVSPI